jgi:hypothetical protein
MECLMQIWIKDSRSGVILLETHKSSPFNIAQNHVRCLKSDKTNKLAHHVSTK